MPKIYQNIKKSPCCSSCVARKNTSQLNTDQFLSLTLKILHSEKALSKITLQNKDFLKYLYFECTVEFTTAAATKQVTIRCQHLKNVKTRLTIYMTMTTTTTKPEPRRISCFTFWAAQKTTYHYFGSGHQLAQPLHTLNAQ